MSAKIFDKDQIGKEAKNSIRGQRHRCNNPNASDYKYYGAKGIKVEYSSKDFYTWFKKCREKIPLNIKVNVDRIDHNKNYSFSNIRLVPKYENVAESNSRTKTKAVAAYTLPDFKLIKKFKSLTECAKYFNYTINTVFKHCKYKPVSSRYKNSVTFRKI